MAQPKGIGGWLLLPTAGLFLSAIVWPVIFVVSAFSLYFEFSSYDLFLLISAPIMCFISVFALVLEFKHKRSFPNFAIAFLWIFLVWSFVGSCIDFDFSTILSDALNAAIWTQYFLVSKRVKNTFTES